MRVLMVTGSRSWTNKGRILESLYQYDPKEWVVIHGDAHGADRLAGACAKQLGFEVEIYPADWAKYGRAAGFVRNAQMASIADECLAFWDGSSKGTAHAIQSANAMEIPVKTFWSES